MIGLTYFPQHSGFIYRRFWGLENQLKLILSSFTPLFWNVSSPLMVIELDGSVWFNTNIYLMNTVWFDTVVTLGVMGNNVLREHRMRNWEMMRKYNLKINQSIKQLVKCYKRYTRYMQCRGQINPSLFWYWGEFLWRSKSWVAFERIGRNL